MLPADMMTLTSIAAVRAIASEIRVSSLPQAQVNRLAAMLGLAQQQLIDLHERLRDEMAEEWRHARDGSPVAVDEQVELPSNVIPFQRRR